MQLGHDLIKGNGAGMAGAHTQYNTFSQEQAWMPDFFCNVERNPAAVHADDLPMPTVAECPIVAEYLAHPMPETLSMRQPKPVDYFQVEGTQL